MDDNISQSRVLITGATGFIGSALAAHFYAQGMHVRALTRDLSHPVVKQHPQYEWMLADLTEPLTLQSVCDDINFVFHCAGFAHASKSEDPSFKEKHHQLNYVATINLAKLAINCHVKRFIYFSTIKACAEGEGCLDETWERYPEDAYGISKRQAEETLLKLTQDTSMDVVVLRLSLVYGPKWKGNLAVMLKAIDKNWFPPLPVITNQRSMVSLYDVCVAATCAATAELKKNRIFIVTDGKLYATHELYQAMRVALGKKQQRWAVSLWIWQLCGKMGDAIQKVIKHTMPINSEAIDKLFGNAAYRSLYIKNELEFVPQKTFDSVLPEIVSEYRKL